MFEASTSATLSIHSTSFPLSLFSLPITLLISTSGSCHEVSTVYLGFNVRKRIDIVMLVLDYRVAMHSNTACRVQSRLQIIEHGMQNDKQTLSYV